MKRNFKIVTDSACDMPAEYFVVRAEDGDERAVCDYIAGMTDNYALDMYHQLFIPRSWDIT